MLWGAQINEAEKINVKINNSQRRKSFNGTKGKNLENKNQNK